MSDCWCQIDWVGWFSSQWFSPLHKMLISIKNDIQNFKSTSCTFPSSPNAQGVIIYFILQPVAFKGAVPKNAVQCRIASKHDRLQYESTAPLATVQQCHVRLHLAWYIPGGKRLFAPSSWFLTFTKVTTNDTCLCYPSANYTDYLKCHVISKCFILHINLV